MPRKVFISHSYKDAEERQRLLALLPKNVEPFVFPPITVPPEQMISDKLLDAIRECAGLIYLQGGASAQSFWVALERDYALRLGKRVYEFDPANRAFAPDRSSPLELNVFIASTHYDRDAVNLILSVLRERFFALRFDNWNVPREGESNPETYEYERRVAGERIAMEITGAIARGGYVVTFWSAAAAASRWVESHNTDAAQENPDRILFALLDDTPPPGHLLSGALITWPSRMLKALRDRSGGNTFKPEDLRVPRLNIVQIYGDAERSQMHRIDDLIVHLYWLIYRNTRQNQLS